MKTKQYYKKNATKFIESTIKLDMSELYIEFEKYLKGNDILDLGFGSGRDSLYFSRKYKVVSGDIIDEFIEHGKQILNNQVIYVDALEMDFDNMFDGVWACASLLHFNQDELSNVFENIYNALRENGVLYCSFKYGKFSGRRKGRYFENFDEEKFSLFIQGNNFDVIGMTITIDVRPNRSDEKWLNVFLRKCNKKVRCLNE